MVKFVSPFNEASDPTNVFVTRSPLQNDRLSGEVRINFLEYDEPTRTIIAIGSDGRKRQCRIDNFEDTEVLRELTRKLQLAYDTNQLVQFVSAGGNSPDIWFYDIKHCQ